MKSFLYTLLLTLIVTVPSYSQVVLNEYSASNLSSYLDNYNSTEDWIELYNQSAEPVDISGFHLSDKSSKETKWMIPEGTTIGGNGFLRFWCSGRDEVSEGHYHTNFKLGQTEGKDEVVFADPAGVILDMTEMVITLVEHSISREMDGTGAWKVCTNPTLASSNNTADKYERYTNPPSMDQEAGFYQDSVVVTLTNNDPGSTLRYTLDGTNPVNSSPEYIEPIKVEVTTVIKAQSFTNDANLLTGKMDFNTYFVDEDDFSVAVFSVAADEVITLANGQGEIIPIGSLEYFHKDTKQREAVGFGSLNRHGQDSWVLPHRSLDWVTRDEMGYTKSVNAPLFSYSDRDEYQKFMFRNSGDDNYPAINDNAHRGSTHIRDEYVQTLALEGDMKLDTRAQERVVLFLNGQYWGLYGMRDRPVDHDYTDFYYDQGKYDTQFLSTWGTTEIEYGGQQAVDDWARLRDYVLNNDMSIDSNYAKVKDELNTTSMIDYMLMNLNVVAIDWLNYNTGWWRGLNPDGDHKKWGYILWDLDATFDYYINYTGVPNQDPDALPCDMEVISQSMDAFWGVDDPNIIVADCPTVINGSCPHDPANPFLYQVMQVNESCCNNSWTSGCEALFQAIQNSSPDPDSCNTILNGSSPYPANDPIFVEVVNQDAFCCESDWDATCQSLYNDLSGTGGGPGGEITGNFGKHEKIFLKLIEESPAFQQQYYSRQADLMNTVFSCENMNETLDRMLDVIRPEMPRQIDRWGGNLQEWESNVEDLKEFINARCSFLGEGMTDCYDLTGPHQVTIMTEPVGVGDDVEFNSLKIEDFPWTGEYFGNMENIIEADRKDGDYLFSHWVSTNGNVITPNELAREARLNLSGSDTLIAVYELSTATEDLALDQAVNVYPNPTTGKLSIVLDMEAATKVSVDLYSTLGRYIATVKKTESFSSGRSTLEVDIEALGLPLGLYILKVNIDEKVLSKKVSYVR